MKKNLIIFTLFVILAVTYFLQETKKPELNNSAGYHLVFSDGFKPEQITSILFYPPGNKDKGVIIARDESRDGEWLVKSRFNAPAEKFRVDQLLDQIKTMEGEERADDPSLLARFSLEDGKSYHLVLSGEKGELYHILIGKRSETPGYGFLRVKGGNRVFLSDREFRYEFGINGDGVSSPPDYNRWVDKRIVSVKREEIRRISYGDKNGKIVFERDFADAGDDKKKGGPHDKPAEKWSLVKASGASRKEVEWESIRPLVSALASMEGSDIATPELKAESGFNKPGTSVTITAKDGREERIFLGMMKEGKNEKFYVIKDGQDLLYEIYSSVKKGAFDKFKDVADKIK